ncbi:MAG: Hpt domain-containing protein [Candidatus Xenobiia bacterium LiM19]
MKKDIPVFDRDSLLERMGGDERFVREVINIFLMDAPLQMSAIKASIEKKDIEGICTYAHTLKGAAANVDALTMREICFNIESDARQGITDNVEIMLESLLQEYERFKELT